ncbi:hypothetical protein [Roseomonas elaeocarpi]|uniref:Uncharacterized protein n=1 Tax=Roseomonas elaeocarpi TaxID=907779 RepID=A0ABV6JX47_9PROT
MASENEPLGVGFDASGDRTEDPRWRWFYNLLPPALVILVVLAFWRIIFSNTGEVSLPLVLSAFLSVFLAFLPSLICVVQNTSKRRQHNRLSSLRDYTVSRTVHYRAARTILNTDIAGRVDRDYAVPMFSYFVILFGGFLTVFIGFFHPEYFRIPMVVLAGMRVEAGSDTTAYQLQSFSMLSFAFLAAYIYSLGRLLDRVNNNDLYPISLYYYAARIVIAVVVAAVLRHAASAVGLNGNSWLLLIAFTVGFAPDLLILALMRRGFQAMKIWGVRDDPAPDATPSSFSLLLIDDLSREKIDRLNELGIDNAQVLSQQNPFLLLPRLPYDLVLIVEWIAQAQLYCLVGEQLLGRLRADCVRNICDLHERLRDAATRDAFGARVGLPAETAGAILRQIEQTPSFGRLWEVRQALLLDLQQTDTRTAA